MRYLVFGDVHANIDALDAVLAAGAQRGAEAYLFVGDLVGYGPSPMECIERLVELQKRSVLAWVAGNHELVVREEVEPEDYSTEALETLEWTRGLVERESWASKFLAAAPLSVQVNDAILLTHDSLANPGSAGYHRWPQNAKSEFACLRWKGGRICFYGHTHMMRAEVFQPQTDIVLVPMDAHEGDGTDPHPLRLAADVLGWVGTGSVGLPTNPKRWPEYLILDDAEWTIEKYVADYPREKARERAVAVLGRVCSQPVVERIARWL